jgi:cardiolipin synthase (CMP-forming)
MSKPPLAMTTPALSNRIATIPNAISLMRLVIAGALPMIPTDWRLPALATGAASDLVDGYLAKQLNQRTVVGQILDPIADKALVLSALVTLLLSGEIEWRELLLVLSRDVVVLVSALTALMLRDWRAFSRMKPSFMGKIATVFIYSWLVASMIPWAQPIRTPSFFIAVVCSAATAVEYLARYLREVTDLRARRTQPPPANNLVQ